ncbi:CTP synthase [Egibacter rhizosphaerae]|uniref:CTP synthase n=1 Tax=Egibacter rhizosphaerae TaxID=1670831 RepID=A0A411YK78_9ACTN|nr:CTP synthase [Egibacter rhizosphaerae]QBI21587.1 CTP synthase [Egibacter rhizosphaerae]
MAKHILVTGGVSSSLGKGITAASLGRLLKARGLRVTMQKLDPYVNVDPGTMNPFEHGEVFVTEDGGETDLDLGHYERFIDESLHKVSSVTTGQIYQSVIAKERRGDYLGKTVQVVPHVTDEIKSRILALAHEDRAAGPTDVVITEVGGTVGDIEGLPFLEAIRQLRYDVGREQICYVHCALVPFIGPTGELKTKPAQHSVRELRSIGIQPDALVLRSDRPLSPELKQKVAMLSDVDVDGVVSAHDADSLYAVPLRLREEGLDDFVVRRLRLDPVPEPDLTEWSAIVDRALAPQDRVRIAVVGKYTSLPDAYLSVVEALGHAGVANGVEVEIAWVSTDELVPGEDPEVVASLGDAAARRSGIGGGGNGALDHGLAARVDRALGRVHGILVPGGFGVRGIEGKVVAAQEAREREVPYLGICLGLQVAIIEYARHVLGLREAHSTEFAPETPDPVVDLMPDQHDVADLGGTMRLGTYPCRLTPGTRSASAYGEPVIYERHRHRWEVNNRYRSALSDGGMTFAGLSPDDRLVEIIELEGHPWFVGTQFHPEFRSRPNRPHPLFAGFVAAARERMLAEAGRLPELDDPRDVTAAVRGGVAPSAGDGT